MTGSNDDSHGQGSGVSARRRRLIRGAALAGPAIVTLHSHRAWAVSSCGQVAAGAQPGNAPATGTRRNALEAAGHDLPDDGGINPSCLISGGIRTSGGRH
jgi:hypothetical protein